MKEQLEVKEVDVDEKEHCDGHAGADGPHDDAKAETRRGEDDASNLCQILNPWIPNSLGFVSLHCCCMIWF